MKKIVMVFSLLTMVACKEVIYITEPNISDRNPIATKTDTIVVTGGLQSVNIRIDWAKFNTVTTSKFTSDFMANAVSDNGLKITHVGARLVYPNENASFSQSAARDTTNARLITMQVPPTNTAHLYVLAVFDSGGVRKALKMGVKRNISIPANGSVLFTLDSLTLMDTEWTIDSIADTTLRVVNDTIRATLPSTRTNGQVRVRVTDPYQIGTEFVAYSNRIVKFFGSGFEYGNTTGWRSFGILTNNRDTATSVDTFWPYIDGVFFNLNGEYLVGKQGVIKTTWQ
jgi:hypothetical protein